jgi:hypothetical protein
VVTALINELNKTFELKSKKVAASMVISSLFLR